MGRYKQTYSGKFYCFSPPVMLLTLLIEFGLAAYTIWRYKMTVIGRLVVATLVTLGVFQLAEYMLCGGLGLKGGEWARVGYISISLLPALGIHMAATLARKQATVLVAVAYISAACFIAFFAFVPNSVSIVDCRPNYAVFETHGFHSLVYTSYYYGWLLVGLIMSLRWAKQRPKHTRELIILMAGYAAFLVPTTAVTLVTPETILGVPSIMCGFAVLLALTLALGVMPIAGSLRHPKRPFWRLW